MINSCDPGNVSEFSRTCIQITKILGILVDNFLGGRICHYIEHWRHLTSDEVILQTVMGAKLKFLDAAPSQSTILPNKAFTLHETNFIDAEINKLSARKVILLSPPEIGQFISPIFLSTNRDGGHRLILNLKTFNKFLVYEHFKMETLFYVLKLVHPGCFMASIDLKSAYYSVPSSLGDQKYLKFIWKGDLFHFTCFPNGLSPCPRLFTKLLKPALSSLRERGFIVSAYIDDLYNQGGTFSECAENILQTIAVFTKLGFVIHPQKSVLTPSTTITFLGFIINSITMTVSLSSEKTSDLQTIVWKFFKAHQVSIRDLAKCLVKIISVFPASFQGPLHYRWLENDKTAGLRRHDGNFESKISLSDNAKQELLWWHTNIASVSNPIWTSEVDITIHTDSSSIGWGVFYDNHTVNGLWSHAESKFHTNILELKAAYFALKSLLTDTTDKHIQIFMDNATAISAIKKWGVPTIWKFIR